MISFLLLLFGSGGGVAIGTVLKSATGLADSYSERKENRENQKLLKHARSEKAKLAVIKAIYGNTNSKSGNYATHTRRMLALIAVGTLSIVTIHCVLFCYDPFVTLPSTASATEGGQQWSFAFGFITIPTSNKPIHLTLGHLALMDLGSLQMVLGFYFGGRQR